MTYLLDANVWVALLRRTSPLVIARFQVVAPSADLCLCSVVVAELWYGCARSAKPVANRIAVDALIAPFPSLPYTDLAADHFTPTLPLITSLMSAALWRRSARSSVLMTCKSRPSRWPMAVRW